MDTAKIETQPVERIRQAFQQERPALMPYFTLGYPDYDTSLAVVRACAEAGADMIELGLPFSDPLADGPTIQRSTQVALDGGIDTARCLEAVRQLRADGVEIPLMLMGYYNPVFAYGAARFVADAVAAGASGFIIPDLPPEEAAEIEAGCETHGLGLSYLVAPNSTDERAGLLTERSRGFTYLVSVTGITGARDAMPPGLESFVRRVRAAAPQGMPLAVGFGISTLEQARLVGGIADGVIIGSALIDAVDGVEDPARAAGEFVRGLREALG